MHAGCVQGADLVPNRSGLRGSSHLKRAFRRAIQRTPVAAYVVLGVQRRHSNDVHAREDVVVVYKIDRLT